MRKERVPILELPQVLTSTSREMAVPEWLQGLQIPLYGLTKELSPQAPVVIGFLAGMKTGKTSAIEVLQKVLPGQGVPVEVVQERWWDNPFLADSYEKTNPSQDLRLSQEFFLEDKVFQLLNIEGLAPVLMDLPPVGDLMYAIVNAMLGRMSEADFRTYLQFYEHDINWEDVPAMSWIVWLTISDEALIERANLDLRDFERAAQSDYFVALNAFARYLAQQLAEYVNVVPFDAEQYNYVDEVEDQTQLVRTIAAALIDRGWQPSQS